MSAFVVSEATVSAIVGWYGVNRVREGLPQLTLNEMQELGDVLMKENYRSVNYRYSEESRALPFEMKSIFFRKPIAEIAVFASIHCLNYQSCETPDWEQTDACKLLRHIEKLVIDAFPTRLRHAALEGFIRDLPEWEGVPWGIYSHSDIDAQGKCHHWEKQQAKQSK